ncbi:methionine ABC transporter ATP-binding protein [Amygdalobacter nucleatus]|uniref:methionine ABC transporter ATP-binding protein n=1 Tax=Amygdalobacter nucleatus TaxID=3029274 RepID=UPI0027A5210F|nr:ATP-binding cassette domain-containing protein [Amygdalobacter nucleatus]WEG36347.1 ATP-binding cassette domain-containing protein [Amygdalobacter nucleatus]
MQEQISYLIETKNLRKEFKGASGTIALQDINLQIKQGESFGIIGLSGAGKSTLIRCFNFLERPTVGQVFFKGQDLATLSKKELRLVRREIGMIFQNFNLLAQRTVLDNVIFPLEISGVKRDVASKRALELLDLVQIVDKKDAYPDQLSGGQKQRVAIARALANKPLVLLCDEATSALDPSTTEQILKLLKSIQKQLGITLVIITHQMEVVSKTCERVAVMENSKIVELGYVRDVFMKPQSEVAKRLIMPLGELVQRIESPNVIRLTFDGQAATEPILANLILACKTPLSILQADSKNLDGNVYGQMLIQVPNDRSIEERVCAWLTEHEINFKKESKHD